MIEGRSVLAVITARGGSKGVPRKNIRMVAGKPLIAWTIEKAKKSSYIDRLIVTTDDTEIASIAAQWGCEVPFMRPAELSRDETPGVLPILHALETLPDKYDLVVLLQPTSPLRNVEDIDGCISSLNKLNAPACVSIVSPDKSPYWMYGLDNANRLAPLLDNEYSRRQDLPPIYALNGAVYAACTKWFELNKSFISSETIGYIMPKNRSLDVDDELDLKICSIILEAAIEIK